MVFSWIGNLSSSVDQDPERQLDMINPKSLVKNVQGSEYDQFWKLLGIKSGYPARRLQEIKKSDAHFFCCTFSKGVLKQFTSSMKETSPSISSGSSHGTLQNQLCVVTHSKGVCLY